MNELSSLLVRENQVSIQTIERALQLQVIHGGRLDTILLEMGTVTEAVLTNYLSFIIGFPPCNPSILGQLDFPSLKGIIPPHIALNYNFVPMMVDGEKLAILVAEKLDTYKIDELSFMVNYQIVPYVACECRYFYCLEKCYHIPMSNRMRKLMSQLDGISLVEETPHFIDPEMSIAYENTMELHPIKETAPQISLETTKDPVSLIQAIEKLLALTTKQEIIHYLLEFFKNNAAEVYLFKIKNDLVHGWLSRPENLNFGNFKFRIFENQLFERVITSKAHYIGPIEMNPHRSLMRILNKNRSLGHTVILPIILLEKVSAVLLCNNNDTEFKRVELDGIIKFQAYISEAFTNAIRLSKTVPTLSSSSSKTVTELPSSDLVSKSTDQLFSISCPPDSTQTQAETSEQKPAARDESPHSSTQKMFKVAEENTVQSQLNSFLSLKDTLTDTEPPKLNLFTSEEALKLPHDTMPALSIQSLSLDELLDLFEISADLKKQDILHEILRRGEETLAVLIRKFPGNLRVDRHRLITLPHIQEHSSVLFLIYQFGDKAIPFLLQLLFSQNPNIRFYALFFFLFFNYPDILRFLHTFVLEEFSDIRNLAYQLMRHYIWTEPFYKFMEQLSIELLKTSQARVIELIAVMKSLKIKTTVPMMVELLERNELMIRNAAVKALMDLTKQSFGTHKNKWLKWYRQSSDKSRVLWMIESLDHPDMEIRRLSISELKELTQEDFGFQWEMDKNERQLPISMWLRWWQEKGSQAYANT